MPRDKIEDLPRDGDAEVEPLRGSRIKFRGDVTGVARVELLIQSISMKMLFVREFKRILFTQGM